MWLLKKNSKKSNRSDLPQSLTEGTTGIDNTAHQSPLHRRHDSEGNDDVRHSSDRERRFHNPVTSSPFSSPSGLDNGNSNVNVNNTVFQPIRSREMELKISNAARRLGDAVKQIVIAARSEGAKSSNNATPTQQQDNVAAWKERLLTLLGNNMDRNHDSAENQMLDIDILLNYRSSPKFVLRCMENELPPNLIHCLRLLRVLELMEAQGRAVITRRRSISYNEESNADSSITATTAPSEPISKHGTQKVSDLLCCLCIDPAVGEQLRPHIFGLLALSGSSYPPNGVHIAKAASEVIIAFSRHCLRPSLVWFLHERKLIVHMTDDVKELCGMSEAPNRSSSTICLYGIQAESSGLWVQALRTLVSLVKYSCYHQCTALHKDFETAGGYNILSYATLHSSSEFIRDLFDISSMMLFCFVDSEGEIPKQLTTEADLDESTKKLMLSEDNDSLVVNLKGLDNFASVMTGAIPFFDFFMERFNCDSLATIKIDDSLVDRIMLSFTFSVQQITDHHDENRSQNDDDEYGDVLCELLGKILFLYSCHPMNFTIMEDKYDILSQCLLAFPTLANVNIKRMILKCLEYVCTALPESDYEKPFTVALNMFYYLCKELFRVSFIQDHCCESDDSWITKMMQDVEILCESIVKLLDVNDTLSQIVVNVGFLSTKIEDFLSLTLEIFSRKSDYQFSDVASLIGAPHLNMKGVEVAYASLCRMLSYLVKDSLTLIVPTSSSLASPRDLKNSNSFFSGIKGGSLNSFLFIGITQIGEKSLIAALKVFELKMSFAYDDSVKVDIDCVLDTINNYCELFCRITSVIVSDDENEKIDNSDWKSFVRLLKILNMLGLVLQANVAAQDYFREKGGFETILRILYCFDGVINRKNQFEYFYNYNSEDDILSLVKIIFRIVDASTTPITNKSTSVLSTSSKTLDVLSDDAMTTLFPAYVNRTYLKDNDFYSNLIVALKMMGMFSSLHLCRIVLEDALWLLSHKFNVGDENSCNATVINEVRNPDACLLILSLALVFSQTEMSTNLAKLSTTTIIDLCDPRMANATLEQVSLSGLCWALTNSPDFVSVLKDFSHPLQSDFLEILRRVSSFKMSYSDFIGLLRGTLGLLLGSETGGSITTKLNTIRLPVISSSIVPKYDGTLVNDGNHCETTEKVKQSTFWLETVSNIAAHGERVARCTVGGNSLNNIALFMQQIPTEDKLYALAEQGCIKFIEVESVDAAAKSPASLHNSINSSNASSLEKSWHPASLSGFSFSIWLRFQKDTEMKNGNMFIFDLYSQQNEANKGITKQGDQEYLSVWYDCQGLCFNVISSECTNIVSFPVSPLLAGVWHHILFTVQPPKRTMLSRKSVLGLCVDGRPLETDIKIESVSFLPTAKLFVGAPNPVLATSGMIRGELPIWEVGSILLFATILGPRDAMSIYSAGPDFHGQFWGDRPQRLSLAATATSTFAMLAECGESGNLALSLKRREIVELENTGQVVRDKILSDRRVTGPDPDLLSSIGLFFNVSPENIVCAFHASSSTTSMRDESASRNKRHFSRRLVNVARINSNNTNVSTDAVVYGSGSIIYPDCFANNIQWVGGPNILIPLVNSSPSPCTLAIALRLIRESCKGHIPNLENLQKGGGYPILALLLRKKQMLTTEILEECFAFGVHGFVVGSLDDNRTNEAFKASSEIHLPFTWTGSDKWVLSDLDAMKYLILNHQVWDLKTSSPTQPSMLISFLCSLVKTSSIHAAFNARRLHVLGMVNWTLHFMLQISELYTLGIIGSLVSDHGDQFSFRQDDEQIINAITTYKNGWFSDFPSISATTVGGDPGYPLLENCKCFLRRLLAHMLTVEDLGAIVETTIYTTSVDVSYNDIVCEMLNALQRSKSNFTADVNDLLLPCSSMRVYLIRLIEELIVDGVNQIVNIDGKTHDEVDMSMLPGSVPSPTYQSLLINRKRTGKSKSDDLISQKEQRALTFLSAFTNKLTPSWFTCVLEGSRDEATSASTFRLLILMLQSSQSFSNAFEKSGGFSSLVLCLPKFSTSTSIVISMLSYLLHAPILNLPHFSVLNSNRLCEVFDAESDATELTLSDGSYGGILTSDFPSHGIFSLISECLGRNFQLGTLDGNLGYLARLTNESVIYLLIHRQSFSSAFQEFCRTPDFLEPLVQLICLISTYRNSSALVKFKSKMNDRLDDFDDDKISIDNDSDISYQGTVGDDDLDSNNSKSKDDDFDEGDNENDVFVDWPEDRDSNYQVENEANKVSNAISKLDGYNDTAESIDANREQSIDKLVQLMYHVLLRAVMSGPCVADLLNTLFGLFPIHSPHKQVESFHAILIEQSRSIIEDIIQRGEVLALANCVGICSVLLHRLLSGLFHFNEVVNCAKIIFHVCRSISDADSYAGRTLAKVDSNGIIIADITHYARLVCIAALKMSASVETWIPIDDFLQHDFLVAVKDNLKYLSSKPSGNVKSSKRQTSNIPAQGTLLREMWKSSCIRRCSRTKECNYPDVSSIEEPDRAFVTSLTAHIYCFIFDKNDELLELATSIILILLQERDDLMRKLFVKDIVLANNRSVKIDILSEGGFAALLSQRIAENTENILKQRAGVSREKYPNEKVHFKSFIQWLELNHEDVDLIFKEIIREASSLIPMFYDFRILTPTGSIDKIQKNMLLKLATLVSTTNNALMAGMERNETMRRCYEKISENQAKWEREGIDDLSSGAIHWKFLLRQLKGSCSIWEGVHSIKDSSIFTFGKVVTSWSNGRNLLEDNLTFVPENSDDTDGARTVPNNEMTRWKLDVTEGYERQRRRLLPNYEFHSLYNVEEAIVPNKSVHDVATNEYEYGVTPLNFNISGDNMEATAAILKEMQLGKTQMNEDEIDEVEDVDDEQDTESFWYEGNSKDYPNDNTDDAKIQETENDANTLNQIKELDTVELDENQSQPVAQFGRNLASNYDLINGLLHAGDKPEMSFNVKRCTGLEVCQAILLFCHDVIYIIDGFEQSDKDGLSGEIKRLEKATSTFNVTLRPDGFKPINEVITNDKHEKSKSVGGSEKSDNGKKASDVKENMSSNDDSFLHRRQRLRFADISAVYKRRYQLQQNALEFYDINNNGTLLAFSSSKQRDEVLRKIWSSNIPNAIGSGSSINYDKFMRGLQSKVNNQWVQGKMTNFEYIMHLNSFAGRSYNDLTQYPVFPWVLADYESDEIDLNDPNVYRDLSKPMGALSEPRATQFRERFEALESNYESGDEPPPFHYGTHYSSAAYVLNYLLRLEPFSRLALSLQGGRFDIADRLFQDINASWKSASRENLQDVRELIPEFFYLSEFLVNDNSFDLGVTQHGKAVHHVTLPPWAKGDPRRFIRIHRKALESDYVSRNLHKWADLIFGYKQRGKEAAASLNVFVHVTYEGAVHLDSIEDPIQKESIIAQIQNFGQTPSRIERKPFPSRNFAVAYKDGSIDLNALPTLESLTPPFCVVGATHKVCLRVSSRDTCRIGMTGQADSAVGDMCMVKGQMIGVGKTCALISPGSKYCRYGGSNNGVSVHVAIPSARHREVNRVISIHDGMHRAPITAIKPSRNGHFIVTGCKDSTVRVWAHANNEMTLKATLCGHDESKITSIDVNTTFGTIVTGDAHGKVLTWDLRTFGFLRQLHHDFKSKLSDKNGNKNTFVGASKSVLSVSINDRTGDILTLIGCNLTLFDINGNIVARLVAQELFSENDLPSCAISTNCPEWMEEGIVAVTGHKNGEIVLWGADRDSELLILRHIVQEKAHSCPITCLRIDEERQGTLLVGDKSGKMSVCKSLKLEDLNPQELALIVEDLESYQQT